MTHLNNMDTDSEAEDLEICENTKAGGYTSDAMTGQDTIPYLPALLVCHPLPCDDSNKMETTECVENFTTMCVKENIHDFNNTSNYERPVFCPYSVQQAKTNSHSSYLPGIDGNTSLHISIMHKDEEKSTAIIRHVPDFVYLNIYNNFGQTPAHLAAFTNSSKMIRKLMCAGADIACQDVHGNTPLHIACQHGYLEVVKQLLRPIDYVETLENGYQIPFSAIPQDMNMKNADGLTCLHLSVLENRVDLVCLLMESGADVNLGDNKSDQSALHLAAEQNMLNIVTIFLSYPTTNVDLPNNAGYTPIQLAYSQDHKEMTKLLLQKSSIFFRHINCCQDFLDDSIYRQY